MVPSDQVSAEVSSPEQCVSDAADLGLGELEVQVIDLFVRGVRVLGLPKSVGEIYGLLFVSPRPLDLNTLVGRLSMSKGSASQGLKFLRNLGAVRPVYVAGDRRDHYEAQTELKELVAGFMKGEIEPHLESGAQRLKGLRSLVASEKSENTEFYTARLNKLGTWQVRGREILELASKLLS
ncbi:MAG: DNA-binding transcriptional regulator GbsR (MarR family) [Verrucomicrobiales bacterium]|jgi:DNA-binding transcriptional regulator GbsR (MarR family)